MNRPRRTEVRNDLLRLFLETPSRKEFLDRAIEIIREWCGCEGAGIRALDEWGNIPFVSYAGYGEAFMESECWLSLREDHCVCTRAISGQIEPQDVPLVTTRGSLRTNDFAGYFGKLKEEQKKRFRGVCLRTGYKSLAVVPLRYQGTVLGAIHLADMAEGAFPSEVMEFVESVGPIIGQGIYRFHVEDQLQRNYDIQKAISSLLRLSLENLSLDQTMKRAMETIHAAPHAVFGSRGSLFLAEDGQSLSMKAQGGMDLETRVRCARVSFGECLCGRAARSQKIEYANLNEAHQLMACRSDGAHRHYSVPVILDHMTMGVIHAYFEEGRRRDPGEEERLTAVANTLAGIIARKRAEDELHGLSRRLVQLQEEERRSIGRELHDEIGQSMTVLMLALDHVKNSPVETAGTALAEAQEVATEVMMQVRNLSLQLHCAMLEKGLLPTLSWYLERYGAQTKLKISFRHTGLERDVPREISAAAYRIIQESLTNVARYAGVNQVGVRVWVNAGVLHLKVEDRGRGFDASVHAIGSSTGLQGMKERALWLGGKFEIRSAPGAGTCVSAEFPLPS